MFIKSSLIALALAMSVSATPLVDGLGTPIAFEKRNGLTTADGWFDHAKAFKQMVRDRNKHRKNLINIKRNVGSNFLNKGAHIPPVANYTTILDHEKRQAEPLTDYDEQFWGGNIAIGSNKKSFLIDFDTGSADLWVPSQSCTSSACKNKSKYNPSSSTTSTRKPGTFSIQYGDGSSVSGPVYTDTVVVAGVSVRHQYFSAVTKLSPMFADEADDGIMGLAFPAISYGHQDTFVTNANIQGALKAAVFAFKLAASGSELYLGGANPKLYSGAVEYHPAVGVGFWQIANMQVLSGSAAVVESAQQAIIDSGTTIVYGPPSQVAALYKTIPNSKVYDAQSGLYQFPCSATPSNVGFNWGGKTWTISSANFNLGRVSATMCVGAISGQDLGLGDDVWLLGDSFMKNVYSVFSIDKKAVGFAQLK